VTPVENKNKTPYNIKILKNCWLAINHIKIPFKDTIFGWFDPLIFLVEIQDQLGSSTSGSDLP